MTLAMPWFRLYHRIIDDDKLRLLAFEDRWHFVALCCLKASGLLDSPDSPLRQRQIAVKLGIQVRELEEVGRRLSEVNLIDKNLIPVAWDELQYQSDNSTSRVKKFREKQQRNNVKRFRNGDVTGQETDTDTELLAAKATSKARAPAFTCPHDVSGQVWQDFEKHRRAKKASITETAIAAFRREADKVGWTLEAALIESVARDWRGFKAEWIKDNGTRKSTGVNSGRSSDGAARALDRQLGLGEFAGQAGRCDVSEGAGYIPLQLASPGTSF